MPPKLRSQIIKICGITVAWTFISVFQFFNIYAVITSLDLDVSHIDPIIALKGGILTGIMAGILGGSSVVFVWEKWLRTEPYGWTIISIIASYSLIYFIIDMSVGLFIHSSQLGVSVLSANAWEDMFSEFFSLLQLQNYFFWLLVVIGTLVYFLINDKYGPGMLRAFLLGKYFHPQREERIFMFLDLRSSTEIAERLGEKQYFNFLKDVYRDSTRSILLAKGEVYQYVGDEIVISWPTAKGVENANCLSCFFEIKHSLQNNRKYYQDTYNVIPEFKAGLHFGNVMAGEIGVIKRDIAFSGDVLNTTARIQDKCNELGVDILLSKYLLNKLNLPADSYQTQNVGEIQLRGKEKKMSLYTTL